MNEHFCNRCKCKLSNSNDNAIYFDGKWLIGYLCDKCRKLYQKAIDKANE